MTVTRNGLINPTTRQQRLYTDLCDLWELVESKNPDGRGTPAAPTPTKRYSNVSCYYQYTKNVNTPSDVGNVKEMTILTTDLLHFEAGQEVRVGWFSVNKSLGTDGLPVPQYGEVHVMLGDPNVIPNRGSRRANTRILMAMTQEHPPEGISA